MMKIWISQLFLDSALFQTQAFIEPRCLNAYAEFQIAKLALRLVEILTCLC